MEIVWYRVWSDILAVVSLNTSKAEKCEGCEVSSSLFMQHKWVTWLLQMIRCILSQFISLWDYCIAYLQQKYGHLSRMWQSRGFTSVQVSRAEGWSWERDPGVHTVDTLTPASSARLSPARGRGTAWRAPPRTPRSAPTSLQRRGRVCRRDLLRDAWLIARVH